MAVIETEGLTKRYGSGDDAVVAVDGLDLTVEPGEVFGFLGPNGAGKSTTINMLLSFVSPTAGDARVLGHDVAADPEAVRERVGVLPEGYGLYDRLTGRRHVQFAVEWTDADADAATLLDRVGIDPADADRPTADYSKGMSQRVAMAMALAGDPDLLVLDEPSAGLDPNGIRLLRELVREAAADGTAVFFSSHVLGQVEAVCDRVGIMNDGRLVAVDTVEGLRQAVGARSRLELRIANEPTVDVREIAGVSSVTREDGLLTVTCSDPRAKALVVTRLTAAGTLVLDVTSEEASLGEVFAAYTTGEAGDPGGSGEAGGSTATGDSRGTGDDPDDGDDPGNEGVVA